MTDKIDKELAKLTAKERMLVKTILMQLKCGDARGLQTAKLKGHEGVFRVRKGRLRIIYRRTKATTDVLVIERRSEKTYRDL